MRYALALSLLASLARAGGSDGLAILCDKAILCTLDASAPQVVDQACILVADGKILAVGRQGELAIPAGFHVRDQGGEWAVPGMLDLHSHMGQEGMLADWNDGVYQANPGLRVSSSFEPANHYLQRACAGGVTTVLYLSGSGTNMSGAGVLVKTAPATWEAALIRDPGALKIAQAGNPERWGPSMRRAWMNWNTRNTIRRGQIYAKAWTAFEAGTGPQPALDPEFEVFRALAKGETKVAVHTQIYQVFLTTLTMLKQELGLPIFIAHGTFDSYKAAALCESLGVPAILGPRSVATTLLGSFAEVDTDGRIQGVAAGFQAAGHTRIGFNTDCVHPNFGGGPWGEELPLQAAMGVRYGVTNERLEILRGLTIVPAATMGVEDQVGSLEPGKDADLVLVDGDPTDPRSRVHLVFVDGELVYDRDEDPTVW